jgi:sigma-B regulation protein RsbU (phosphoserine phosphatase)
MATRKTRVRFEERAELLDFLLEVSAITSGTLDLDQLMANVGDIVRQVIPHQLFAILLYSEKRQRLLIRHARGHREEIVANLALKLGEGVTGVAAQTRQPQLVSDVREDERYLSGLDAVRSELAVPMIHRQRLVGVIDLQATVTNAFTLHDRALLQLIASRVAAAVDNARLYRRVERQIRTQRTLLQMARDFSSILDPDALLDKLAKLIHTVIAYDAFSILLVDEGAHLLRHRFSLRYDQRSQLQDLPLGLGLTGAAATSRQPVLARDTLADPRYISCDPGVRSEAAVPLIVKDKVIGVMDLESQRVGYFTDEHVRTLAQIAPQIAIAIENARLYDEIAERERLMEADLEAARQLQRVMLPGQAPELKGLQTGVRWRPARAISGDLYDFYEHGDEAMLAFGDSSGKGAAAALYGALFTGLLRSLAPRRRSPAMLLRSLNETLTERNVPARYVTLLVMLWDHRARRFVMANAGSTPPLICRGGGILSPKVEGVPVGLLENVEYEEEAFEAQPGDVVLLYSDGIQDQTGDGPDEYGRTRLREVLRGHAGEPAQEIADAIFTDLDAWRGPHPLHDDQTIIVLKVD